MASRGKVRSAELSSSDKTATKKAKGVNTASVSDPPLSPENQSELIKELSKGVLDTIRASIQEVIRETIDRELSKAVDKLTTVFEERLSKLESTCRQLEEKVQEPRPTAGESDLQQQVLCLQHALHQEEHAANFVLSGVPEATNQGEENHSKTVIDVCKKELGLEISQSDLLEVRRLGRLPAANTTTTRPQNRPRPILIKTISKSTKMKIVSRARETTQTTRHLFFNEDLTRTEQIRRKSQRASCSAGEVQAWTRLSDHWRSYAYVFQRWGGLTAREPASTRPSIDERNLATTQLTHPFAGSPKPGSVLRSSDGVQWRVGSPLEGVSHYLSTELSRSFVEVFWLGMYDVVRVEL